MKFIILMVWFVSGVFCRAQVLLSTNEVKLVRYDNLKQSCGCFLNESEQRFFLNILAQLRSNKSIGAEAEGRLLPVLPVQPRSFTYWSYDSSRDDLERHYLPFSDNGRSTEYSADLSVEKAMVDLAGRIEVRKNLGTGVTGTNLSSKGLLIQPLQKKNQGPGPNGANLSPKPRP